MDDIVSRLLRERGVLTNEWPGPTDLDKEVAATISRLTAERDALADRGTLQALRDANDRAEAAEAERDRLQERVKAMQGGAERYWEGRWRDIMGALKEIGQLSDNWVNAERYTAEDALDDLQAIRNVIKRFATAALPDADGGGQ